MPLIRMAIAISFAGILLVASYWIITKQYQMDIAQLVLFVMMTQRMLWPLTRLGTMLDNFERARASARRVFDLLDVEPTIRDPINPITLNRVRGEISFNHVSFHYESNLPVLKDLTFNIKPGETVGIAGHTGAGKSTLIKLLLRFYDISSGSIKIDGIDLRSMRLQDLRRNIALVTQDVYLFHGTIRENIAYSIPNVSDEEVIAVAKMAHLHDFVKTLPQSYDTIVGERGIKLSGGQRQRLSIARALLKNAPILILDEATSSVDTETEQYIHEHLLHFTQGRTALIIAHRLSTIRSADRIFVLKNGEIAEEGNHDKLINSNGIYSSLWNVQTGNMLLH